MIVYVERSSLIIVPSSSRFEAIRKLTSEGIFTGLIANAKILPFINDNEENIRSTLLEKLRSGAKFIFCLWNRVNIKRQSKRILL